MNGWDPVHFTEQSCRSLWEVVGGSVKHKEEAEEDRAGRTVRTQTDSVCVRVCVCVCVCGGELIISHSCRGSVVPHANKAHRWALSRFPQTTL